MSLTLSTPAFRPRFSANAALRAATVCWFTVLVAGQIIFAISVAMFYGLTAMRGDVHAWSKHLARGYIQGDALSNTALIIHLVSAVLITLSGAIQFVPHVRRRAPGLHRWNGRIFILTAFSVSLAGIGLEMMHATANTLMQSIGNGVLALLIMSSAAQALRFAIERDFARHRRWALRLFLLTSAALFIRASVILYVLSVGGAGSLDLSSVQGPVLTVLTFAQFAIPLLVLELYFRAHISAATWPRVAMAALLVAVTLVMGAGIAAASVGLFVPNMRAALDPRPSIAEALAQTIKSNGAEAAAQQYYRLHATQAKTYNFDEDELNTLGYDLLRTHDFHGAIRVLQLNTETYPKSANTWDSLGEADMDAGDVKNAIANYEKSLAINPANHNATVMIRKMRPE
jgi:tetratricopeptide (TPR) repeat protein